MTTTAPEALARIRRDPRFRAAVAAGVPTGNWRSSAACLGADPELFFPTPTDDPAPAIALCARCVVRGQCLAGALQSGECEGVWGGTLPDERRAMRPAWVAATRRG